MKLDNINEYLDNIGAKVVRDAKRNLAHHTNTGRLYKETTYKLVTSGDATKLFIILPRYGDVLDKGVSGFLTPQPGAKYKFGGTKQDKIIGREVHTRWQTIREWVRQRGFTDDVDGAAYAINRSLKLRGYPPTKWLTKAIEKNHLIEVSRRPKLVKAFKEDITAHRAQQRKR